MIGVRILGIALVLLAGTSALLLWSSRSWTLVVDLVLIIGGVAS